MEYQKKLWKKYEITCQSKNDKILVFPFFDESGKLQFVKYRNTDFVKGETRKEVRNGAKVIASRFYTE